MDDNLTPRERAQRQIDEARLLMALADHRPFVDADWLNALAASDQHFQAHITVRQEMQDKMLEIGNAMVARDMDLAGWNKRLLQEARYWKARAMKAEGQVDEAIAILGDPEPTPGEGGAE